MLQLRSVGKPMCKQQLSGIRRHYTNRHIYNDNMLRERERERTRLFDKIKSLYNIYKMKK